MAAGFDPSSFWTLTPRLFLAHMEGAAKRLARERELVWFGAMLPHLKEPVTLEKFVGMKPDNRERVRRFHRTWDKIDRALSRSKARKG